MPEAAAGIAVHGTRRAFWASTPAPDPTLVWHRWTTPSTWGDWDLGLRSATLQSDFVVGAAGHLVDTSGRRSRFTVRHVDPGRRCTLDVALPAAALRLTRSLDAGVARHDVAFVGPAAPLFAALLGSRFRRLLSPTLTGVVATSGYGS